MSVRKTLSFFTLLLTMYSYNAMAATTDLSGSASWTALLKGANFDSFSDTQASKAGTEIVGDVTHPSFYINYDDNGTTTGAIPESDDIISLRLRIGDETKSTHSSYAFFGVDANNDGVLDVFFSSGAGKTEIWNAGSDSNTSPSTTSLANASSVTYVQDPGNYDFAAVSVANDPDWSTNDLNGDGNTDVFVSFSIQVSDLDSVLSALGITYTQDTQLRFISLTATQTNSLNSDFNGVDKSSVDDWSLTFADLGIISDPVDSGGVIDSTPPALPTVTSQTSHSTTPVITGTYPSVDAAGGFTVQVNSVTYTLGAGDLVATGDNWSLAIPAGDALAGGTYNVTATVTDGASTPNSSVDSTSNELVIDVIPSTLSSTITASPTSITADGSSTSTITVQLKYANGDNLVSNGGTVLLSTTSGSLSGVTANGDGTYTAILTSVASVSAAIISGTLDGSNITNTATVQFISSGTASTSTSTITASPTIITADGISTSAITVQLKDNIGTNLSTDGGTVVLTASAGSISSVTPNGDGTYSAILTSSISVGASTISGTLDGFAITDTASVQFVVGAASVSTSTITASPATITADGSSTSAITVQLIDANGNTLISNGGTVVLATSSGSISAVTPNGDGTYSATLTSATNVGTATITGTLDTLAITDTASVEFTAGNVSELSSTITASPASIIANGSSTSTISVQLKDANNNDVTSNAGIVLLSTNLGSLSSVTYQGSGVYTAILTSASSAGSATISGTLDAAAITGTASVVFLLDSDGDGVANVNDLDDDNDGIPDSLEGNGVTDSDADGVVDSLDLDSDNDGLLDLLESGVLNAATLDANNDGRMDSGNTVGANGLADVVETAVDNGVLNYNNGSVVDTDGDGVEDFRDLDSDNDGIPDVIEAGGSDGDGDGVIGTGIPTVDANGLADSSGMTPTDSDADGRPDMLELDADNDGILDLVEAGGNDADNDGLVDGFVDTNGDGFDDGITSTSLPLTDSDGNGIPDYQDNGDADNDGIVDSIDLDDDNDGIPDSLEGDGLVDSDSDGIADSLDLDSDNDGLFDVIESGIENPELLDSDNDGRIDNTNSGGNNGLADVVETAVDNGVLNYNNGSVIDTDGDGVADFRDLDSDNDSIPDVIESAGSDPDGDGILGSGTPVVNKDGLITGSGLDTVDTDADGVADYRDLDSDGDGIFDLEESGKTDDDSNGLVDNFTDINGDGFDDAVVAAPLPLTDSDKDGIPDFIDISDDRVSAPIHTGVNGIGPVNPWLLALLASFIILGRRCSKAGVLLVLAMLPMLSNAGTEPNESDKEDFQRRIYVGAGIGQSLMAPETSGTIYSVDDDKDFGYKLYIGLDLNESISAELSMANLGTTTLQPTGEIDYEITSFNALYYFYDQDKNDHVGFSSYLKAGLASINNSANVPYVIDNSFQISIGMGVEYAWADGFAVRGDLESYDDDATLLTVGLLYRFGKQDKKPKIIEVVKKDTDDDGVFDDQDKCPATPADTQIDSQGCKLESDIDDDGVLDEFDQCPATIKGASVNKVGCAIFEAKMEGVNFKAGSADLTEKSKEVLDQAVDALLKFTAIRIEIQAHTDSQGKKEQNQKLSDARARSVEDYLESKGIGRDRMEPKGYGETQPLASNKTVEGRAQNRRVEFRVLETALNVE